MKPFNLSGQIILTTIVTTALTGCLHISLITHLTWLSTNQAYHSPVPILHALGFISDDESTESFYWSRLTLADILPEPHDKIL